MEERLLHSMGPRRHCGTPLGRVNQCDPKWLCAGEVRTEREVAEPGADVDEEMRDDERPRPPAPEEVPSEEQAEEEVPKEPSPALVQVVGGAQRRARGERCDRRPPDLSESRDQVADDDDLLE